MATQLGPGTRYSTSDWSQSNYTIKTNAERQRSASHDLRQEGKFMRNETDNKTKWDQYDNNTRLSDRVDNIRKWKDILDRTLDKVNTEIKELSATKDLLECSLEAKNLPTDVNIENLVIREQRRAIDVVADEVEHQLRQEQKVIQGIKSQLQQRIDEAFEQLCQLQEARHQLLIDLQDKNVALGIDVKQYNLTDESSRISYKPDPLRVPKGSTTPQNWQDFSQYNKDRAEAQMDASRALREASHHTLQQTDNDLEAQDQATNFAFRKRMYELKRALNELKNQKDKTEQEIADLENEIRRLVDAIHAKTNPTKLAETRLENRTERPHVELCRDGVQYGLVDEVKQLNATREALEEKLKQAQHGLDGLEKNLHRINEDIGYKTNSLMKDEQCMQSRDKLVGKKSELSQRNPYLTGMVREKSHVLA